MAPKKDYRFRLKPNGDVLAKVRTFRVHIAGATGPLTIAFESPTAPATMFTLSDTLDVRHVEASKGGVKDNAEFVTVYQRKAVVLSRSARWAQAAADAKQAIEELQSIQSEFESWRDNMSENLQSSPTYEKLETVCDIDIQGALDAIEEAESADLPAGFGRD